MQDEIYSIYEDILKDGNSSPEEKAKWFCYQMEKQGLVVARFARLVIVYCDGEQLHFEF